jgi:hypothetical protein
MRDNTQSHLVTTIAYNVAGPTGPTGATGPTGPSLITVNTTPITGGVSGRVVYDNAGTFGEASAITTNGSNALTIGTQGPTGSQGSLILANTSTAGYFTTLKSSNTNASAWIMTLPTGPGSNSYVLTTDGSGVTSWASAASAITADADTTTATPVYPLFSLAPTGTLSTIYTSDPRYNYTPSTGLLAARNVASSQGIVFNSNTISVNTSIPSGYNGMSAGPVAVGTGAIVTVPANSRWVVV